MFALAESGWASLNTPLSWESVQSVLVKQKPLTFSALVLISLGSLVVCDAPHHARLMANHLGFGSRVRLDLLPRLNDLFLGLDNLFFGWFEWGFGSRGLFVGYFYSLLRFLIISVLQT